MNTGWSRRSYTPNALHQAGILASTLILLQHFGLARRETKYRRRWSIMAPSLAPEDIAVLLDALKAIQALDKPSWKVEVRPKPGVYTKVTVPRWVSAAEPARAARKKALIEKARKRDARLIQNAIERLGGGRQTGDPAPTLLATGVDALAESIKRRLLTSRGGFEVEQEYGYAPLPPKR